MSVIGLMFLFLTCINNLKTGQGEALNRGLRMKRSSDNYTNTLLDIAKYGLPETSDPKHVVVIGAGIAGLTAAKLLKDAGHNVTMLEASNRVGGRILTHRDPENRYYADLGAMRIPYQHKFTKTFVDYFNVSTSDIIGYDEDAWFYIKGKRVRVSELEKSPDVFGFNTSSEEKGKSVDQLIGEAITQVVEECQDGDRFNDACLTKYDHHTFKGYLIEVAGLSDGAVQMIGAVSGLAESHFYTAFTEILRWLPTSKKYEIVGGTDLLPQAFLPELENNIIFNSRVTRVEHGNDTVVAYYNSSGTEVEISGDLLLATATATSTSFIKFVPALNYDKQDAIRNLHYDSVTKIQLVFQRPFWKDDGIFGGESVTDLPSRYIVYPSHDFESGLGVLLASYTLSDQSQKFLGLSDEQCLTQVLNDLAEIHGDYIRELYLEGVVKKWSLDPYSLGAFAAVTPFQLKDLYIPLILPEGNLFFAGEHTELPHGWIDTAIRSAVEAANCISTNECYPDLEMSMDSGMKSNSVVFVPLIKLLAALVFVFK